jgi:hypothetical protein
LAIFWSSTEWKTHIAADAILLGHNEGGIQRISMGRTKDDIPPHGADLATSEFSKTSLAKPKERVDDGLPLLNIRKLEPVKNFLKISILITSPSFFAGTL